MFKRAWEVEFVLYRNLIIQPLANDIEFWYAQLLTWTNAGILRWKDFLHFILVINVKDIL